MKKPQIISALGCVPKSDGNIRLIHDDSHPSGSALNDFSTTMPKQRFQTVADALHLMSLGCYFAKVDLKSAYRSVAIHPSNFPYMGLKWTFKDSGTSTYMVDKHLCFGARNSLEYSTDWLGQSVEWCIGGGTMMSVSSMMSLW